jgi:serine/threonine protein kinase
LENTPSNQTPSPAVGGSGADLAPGMFIGEYKIESKLGQGGMGAVYAARHPVIGKRVAVKVLSYFFSRDAALVRRFTDEARAVNKIGHPNIIDVFSFGQLDDGRQYFVMEFLEGETMSSWLAKGRPAPAEAKRFLLQVCEALEAAHREGIIHRDLKPDNIWIARPKHGEPFIKVLDFGIAKLVETDEEKNATRTGTVMGTPQFMSPEQCVGRGVDHRTDIYALGAIIFRTYCGRLPFDGDSAAEIIAAQLYAPPPKPSELVSMPATLEILILDCLDKNPEHRPATAADLGRRFKDAASMAGVVTEVHAPRHATGQHAAETRKGYTSSESDKDDGTAKGRRQWIVLALIGALLVAGAMVLVFSLRNRTVMPVIEVVKSPPPASQPNTPAPVPESKPAPPPPTVLPQLPPPVESVQRSGRTRPTAAKAPTAATPDDRTAPAETRHKPSRAAREGLIQENPF